MLVHVSFAVPGWMYWLVGELKGVWWIPGYAQCRQDVSEGAVMAKNGSGWRVENRTHLSHAHRLLERLQRVANLLVGVRLNRLGDLR